MEKRNVRFGVLNMLLSSGFSHEVLRESVEKSGLKIFQSELEKFCEKYPNYDRSQVENFVKNYGILKNKTVKGSRKEKDVTELIKPGFEYAMHDIKSRLEMVRNIIKEIKPYLNDDVRVVFSVYRKK